jgi:putative endonuclease
MTARGKLGDAGERYAERLLRRDGWRILERQRRGSNGEVDLIALDGEVLVVVEVKTGPGARMGAAEEAVSPAKAGRLLALRAEYATTHPDYADCIWRVDLVAITLDTAGTVERVTHIRNAFTTG